MLGVCLSLLALLQADSLNHLDQVPEALMHERLYAHIGPVLQDQFDYFLGRGVNHRDEALRKVPLGRDAVEDPNEQRGQGVEGPLGEDGALGLAATEEEEPIEGGHGLVRAGMPNRLEVKVAEDQVEYFADVDEKLLRGIEGRHLEGLAVLFHSDDWLGA